MDRSLGRRVEFDERSRNFPIMTTMTTIKPRSYTWSVNQWLDQGADGACVGYAWAHDRAARPKVHKASQLLALELYWEAQRLDAWEGGAYDGASPFYEGSSVLAGAKASKSMALIGSYRWAFGLLDLRMALGYKGPAILGINWYDGMFDTDELGYVKPTGSLAGGHAILAFANDESRKRVRLWNSWGKSWGKDGTAYISYTDLNRLLQEDGEACVPMERT